MLTTCTARAVAAHDVPVVASTAVGGLLRRSTPATVLARFPAAVYVLLPDGAVLSVVASDGLRLPNALVVTATSAQAPFAGHDPGTAAAVTDGDLLVGAVRYRPVRSWAPRETTAGRLRPDAVAELAALVAAAPSRHTGEVAVRLRAGAGALADAVRTGDGHAADALLGLGPGLTPAGDDLLAGALVTCAHLGGGLPELASRVRRRGHLTTALSADLLRHACAGRAAPPVLGLVDALVGARPVAPALTDLLALGATSGADTATGVLVAARALLDRPAAR